jgi:hypothetical protein
MGLIFTQSADNEVITVPVGTTVGTVRVTKNNVTFRGSDRDTCIIQGDATFAVVFQASGSTPSTNITVENCTIDCNNNAGITAAFGTDLPDLELLTLNNVKIVGVKKAGLAILNEATLVCNNVEIYGDGGGIQCTQDAVATTITNTSVYGGKFGFVVSSGYGPTVEDIVLQNFKVYPHYWASPTYESCTVTSVDAAGVNVVSNTLAHRSITDVIRLLKVESHFTVGSTSIPGNEWDRVEVADGRWAQIRSGQIDYWKAANSWRPAATPTGEYATVYKVILGKLWTASLTRVSTYLSDTVTPNPHWRDPTGKVVPLTVAQQATRCDILRADLQNLGVRDVDTGGIHCTDTCLNPSVINCYVEGGFSDCITIRSESTITNCESRYGQDFGFTLDATDGPVNVVSCRAYFCGVNGFGFYNGNGTISNSYAEGNGFHMETAGYGFRFDDGLVVTGSINGKDNFKALYYGQLIQPGRAPRPVRRKKKY